MYWLTLDKIRQQVRLEADYTDEDTLLKAYGDSAEEVIADLCGTTPEKLLEDYGTLPKRLEQAALMLVDWWYQQRSPVSQMNLSVVPYTFDVLVKPFVKLT